MNAQIVRFPGRPDPRNQARPWEPWVDEHALARHFSVHPRTVRRWRLAGMPSKLIGGARRYRIGECEHWHERFARQR